MKLKKRIKGVIDTYSHRTFSSILESFGAERVYLSFKDDLLYALKQHKKEKKAKKILITPHKITFKEHNEPPTVTVNDSLRIEIPVNKTIDVVFVDSQGDSVVGYCVTDTGITYNIY